MKMAFAGLHAIRTAIHSWLIMMTDDFDFREWKFLFRMHFVDACEKQSYVFEVYKLLCFCQN